MTIELGEAWYAIASDQLERDETPDAARSNALKPRVQRVRHQADLNDQLRPTGNTVLMMLMRLVGIPRSRDASPGTYALSGIELQRHERGIHAVSLALAGHECGNDGAGGAGGGAGARPVRVEGGSEQWWVHRDTLGLLGEERQSRTTLLFPFDNLICDRDRTGRLWDSVYRNEIYVPKHKWRYDSYVMLVLAGEQLIGRVVPRMDPQARRARRRGGVRWGGFGRVDGGCPGGGGRVAGLILRRRFDSLGGPGDIRRILCTGESAGRSRRAQAR
jgi:hypothetical protein